MVKHYRPEAKSLVTPDDTQPSRERSRAAMACTVIFGTVAGLAWLANSLTGMGANTSAEQEDSAEITCVVPEGTGVQEVTLQQGDGVHTVAHAIEGSGNIGDPCWDTAVELAEEAIERQAAGGQPRAAGAVIEVPEQIESAHIDE